MTGFAQWLSEIPEQVRDHLEAVGLTTAEMVADSVAPEVIKDTVFIETIAKHCNQVVPATAAWAQVRKFDARCHAEAVTQASAAAAHPEVEEITAADPAAEEYYNLSPTYRKKRLEAF